LIAALTDHLLVVQCAIKSGSMITVKYAIELDINVATIPDFPSHYESSGNLNLLQEGAVLIKNANDLADFVGWGSCF
jgi:DNA processing protein